LGAENVLNYDFDSYINSSKYECMIKKTAEIKNRRPEEKT
jgi:hypothetical protein